MSRSHESTGHVGCFLAALAALTAVGCGEQVTAPAGDILLESLDFLHTGIQPGQPLILVAHAAGLEHSDGQPFLLRTSSGANQARSLKAAPTPRPWDALSNEELAAVIEYWDNVVMIRFKEADALSGVDEQGKNVTSDETVERLKEWVREQGVTITSEWILHPGISGTMPGDPGLVSTLRAHENVDLVEPGGIVGEYTSISAGAGARLIDVILTDGGATGAIDVHAGETITAEYRQPDGSTLRATAVVR